MARKQPHCVFVEDEVYNWGNPKSVMNRRLLMLSILFVSAGLLFSVLR